MSSSMEYTVEDGSPFSSIPPRVRILPDPGTLELNGVAATAAEKALGSVREVALTHGSSPPAAWILEW